MSSLVQFSSQLNFFPLQSNKNKAKDLVRLFAISVNIQAELSLQAPTNWLFYFLMNYTGKR